MQKFIGKGTPRLLVLTLFLFLLFCFIIAQFFKVQIVEGEKWTRQAKAQHQYAQAEPFKRGRFFCTSIKPGHPHQELAMALDIKKYHLYIDPATLQKGSVDEISEALTGFLHAGEKEKATIREQFDKQSRSRRLKCWLTEVEKAQIEKWWLPYAKWNKLPKNGVFFLEDYQRSYPFGQLLGAVINSVREERDPETHQCFPTGGLELTCNSYLKGVPGKRLRMRSPRQSLEGGVVVALPEDGADVYLTIDPYIQAIAEEEVRKGVKAAGARAGWAVLMDPVTGEIYALAQYPEFDPSRYRDYYNDPNLVEYTNVKAVTNCFEPGSTQKPISVAIASMANQELEKQGKPLIFNPAQMVATHDGRFPGRKKPISDVGSHRYLNMYLAMQKSSNIYVARLIQRIVGTLGDEWYREQLSEVFRFGRKTQIELPSESYGWLPKPNQYYPSGRPQWSVPTPFSLSFGYNLLVNTIQMVRAWGILINGGCDVHPTLIRKIVKEKGEGESELIYEHSTAKGKQLLPQGISRELAYSLQSITQPGGSGSRANIPGFTEGGKTGTTEQIVKGKYSKQDHFSSFVGFSPVESPKFLLFVGIDAPEYRALPGIGRTYFGSGCAAPVFRRIMHRTYDYLGMPPDDPYGYLPGDPRADREKAQWAKEAKVLKDLYTEWNR